MEICSFVSVLVGRRKGLHLELNVKPFLTIPSPQVVKENKKLTLVD